MSVCPGLIQKELSLLMKLGKSSPPPVLSGELVAVEVDAIPCPLRFFLIFFFFNFFFNFFFFGLSLYFPDFLFSRAQFTNDSWASKSPYTHIFCRLKRWNTPSSVEVC